MTDFYKTLPGFERAEVLPASGSHRIYSRLFFGDGHTEIGVENETSAENASFIAIDRHLRSKGLRVPEVYAVSDNGLCYTQQDLGDVALHDCLGRKDILLKVMEELPALQFGGADFDFSKCFSTKQFGSRIINFDLNYFKYCFLRTYGALFDENLLQDDFDRLCSDLLSVDGDTFFYRDFQSRNVMVHDGEPWYIDFQGGFRGPFYYDLVSFIYHASSAFSNELRIELKTRYFESLQKFRKLDRRKFDSNLDAFALLRIMQALGAYGFRGLTEHKRYFEECIPAALRNLASVPADRYPYIRHLALSLVEGLDAGKEGLPEKEVLR